MSSTNRSESRIKHIADYYKTPVPAIVDFLMELGQDYPTLTPCNDGLEILDPCAGGSATEEMSYPTAIRKWILKDTHINTLDIRDDSPAKHIGDYLKIDLRSKPNCIITNPPFNLALEIIQKALNDVKDDGVVIMLLRFNFFGSQKRKEWFQKHMPIACYLHSKRMSFTNKGTDSIEYMHAVWQKNSYPKFTNLRII